MKNAYSPKNIYIKFKFEKVLQVSNFRLGQSFRQIYKLMKSDEDLVRRKTSPAFFLSEQISVLRYRINFLIRCISSFRTIRRKILKLTFRAYIRCDPDRRNIFKNISPPSFLLLKRQNYSRLFFVLL